MPLFAHAYSHPTYRAFAVGAGGLPSRGPVGKISRAMVVELADRKITEMQAQQRVLREKALLAPPIAQFVGCADPVRARIHKTQCANAAAAATRQHCGVATLSQTRPGPTYLPTTQTRAYSPIGSRRMRCASAETARFEVALSLPERARSSPPRRLPPFNVARPASRASQPASQAFEVTVSRPHAGPPVGATTHPKAKGASHVK